jgi:hypothetical protein
MSRVSTDEFRIDVTGEVVEWQTLLNGTKIATFEGASPDGAWTFSGSCSWNPRSGPEATEADLVITRADGAEIFATLAAGSVVELPSDAGNHRLSLRFEIDGGAGDFADVSGMAETDGHLRRQGFSLEVRVDIHAS